MSNAKSPGRFSHLVKAVGLGVLLPAGLAAVGLLGVAQPAVAANAPVVQTFYVPLPENQLLEMFRNINTSTDTSQSTSPITSNISISPIANETIVYYDHWEDGYEPDINNPVQPTTQIWGDGNIGNGAPPGVTTNAGDVVNAGGLIILKNDVATTTGAVTTTTPYQFNGRDKIAVSKTVAISRVNWAVGSTTNMAQSTIVYDTNDWGTEFRSPLGANATNSYAMFEYSAFAVMAGKGGATIQVDWDNNGTTDYTQTLTEGQSYLTPAGTVGGTSLKVGAKVTSDKPVQVNLLTGDINTSAYKESRDAGLLPVALWSKEYYTPVSTETSSTSATASTRVWLYNPGTSNLTVSYSNRGTGGTGAIGTSTVTVNAGSVNNVTIPAGTGAKFSASSPFYAYSTTDSVATGTGAGNTDNSSYDWGYPLNPVDTLTQQFLVGWAKGKNPNDLNSTENSAPVWATVIGNGETPATVYVDLKADGLGALTDPNGNKYDLSYSLKELQQVKIYDNTLPAADQDQSGMLVYVLAPGVKLSGAWGEDPKTASLASPGLDAGTGISPTPLFDAGKTATLVVDTDNDGVVSPGDTIEYDILINNISRVPVPDVVVADTLPVDTTYVGGSTKYRVSSGGVFGPYTAIPDGPGGTLPLTGGYTVASSLPVGQRIQVVFLVLIDSYANLTPGTKEIVNTGSVTSSGSEVPLLSETPIYGSIGDQVWLDANNDGVFQANESGLSGVTVELKDGSGNSIDSDPATPGVQPTTAVTDANGNYLFSALPVGSYIVAVVSGVPANLSVSTGTTDPTGVINLSAGEAYLDADFGYKPDAGYAVLGDTVWYDVNNNGLQDPGEAGIGGVSVQIRPPADVDLGGGLGVTVTRVTGPDGSWLAIIPEDATPSQYTVFVNTATLPGGLGPTPTNMGGDDTYIAPVKAGDVLLSLDFGYTGGTPASIGDTVWLDANDDGDRDDGEVGLSGVTLSLYTTGADGISGTADDQSVAVTTTDANGEYRFSGLLPGEYYVKIAGVPTGLAATLDTGTTGAGANASNGETGEIALSAGQTYTLADFGYNPTVGAGLGALGGTIWHDTLTPGGVNGTLQPGEPRLQGVSVQLWLDNGDGVLDAGDTLLRTTLTDANGDYEFLGLPAGTYFVQVTDTTGVTSGMTSVTGPNPTLDNNGHTNPYKVVLPNNVTDLTIDFAYQASATPLTVSGTVFEDNGAGGVGLGTYNQADPNKDVVAPNALVTLYRVLNEVEYPFATTTTDASGFYEFANLPPTGAGEAYRIEVNTAGTIVVGMQQTTDPDSDPARCGIGTAPPCDSQTTFPLTADKIGVNFGYWNGGVVTTPVSLSYFRADAGTRRGQVVFEWATATEVSTIGFDLYVEDTFGEWQPINADIIPSLAGDSVETRNYRFEASGVRGKVFMIVDIDAQGVETWHGPFAMAQNHGVKNAPARATDWNAINAESDAKQKARNPQMRNNMQKQIEKAKSKLKFMLNKDGRTGAADSLAAPWAGRVAAAMLSFFVGTAQAADLPVLDSGLLRLEVKTNGIQRVTHQALLSAGVDLAGVDPTAISVRNRGQGVPVYVYKGTNGAGFGPGGYIEFLGEGLDTLYTATNVYNLYLDGGTAAPIVDDATPPPAGVPVAYYLETLKVEPQSLYHTAARNGDPWYAAELKATSVPVKRNFTLKTQGYAGAVAPATLAVGLWGAGSGKHHVQLRFNGAASPVADKWFEGNVDYPIAATLPVGAVVEGNNTLAVELPFDTGGSFDRVMVDEYSLTYPRRFLATSGRLAFTAAGALFKVDGLPSTDVRVYRVAADGRIERLSQVTTATATGGYSASFAGTAAPATYYVSAASGLYAPTLAPPAADADIATGPASYLVIAHPDFLGSALDSLAQVRRGQGYTVKIANLDAVYAQFGDGILDPQAIRDYIAYAYRNLGTRMVLLVGGDTYDYRNYRGLQAKSFVPSLYAQTSEEVTFAPVDPKYADVDGDDVPDLALGRLPARSSLELATLIDKTLAYEDAEPGYAQSAVFAADAYDAAQQYSFKSDAEALVEQLPEAWKANLTPAYIDDLGMASARSTLVARINAGVSLTSFVGHSATNVWTFGGLFSATDAAALTNSGRPTIVTQWGCWNTYYVAPKEDTLAHRFLLNGDRGAAAVVGASTLTRAGHERALALKLNERLFQSQVPLTLGEAILEAKRDYAATNPGDKDVILGWTLLGDPAIAITP